MKKFIIVLLALCCVTAVFADDISPIDIRSLGMGGAHTADSTDYFTLYRNPSLIQKSGKHWYWDTLTVNLAMPYDQIPVLMDELEPLMSSEEALTSEELQEAILNSETVKTVLGSGVNLGLNMNIPLLSFGGTGKHFGWGLYNRLALDVDIPSLTGYISGQAYYESGFILGYGTTLQLSSLQALSLGTSVTAYGLAPQASFRASATDVLDDTSAIMQNLNLTAKTGVNVDAALTYSLGNFMDAAVVAHNILSSSWTAKAVIEDPENIDVELLTEQMSDPVYDLYGTPMKISAGVGLKIPTWWSFGIISNWNVYADQYDVLNIFSDEVFKRNPWLDVGAGTEITLLRFLDLRAGLANGYLNAGVGMNLGAINVDFAFYGKELSKQPGARNQLNATLALSLQR